MSELFDRVRVLWPDHLGLARGKYVPAGLADRGTRHCTGTWSLGYDRGMTRARSEASGMRVCPTLTPPTTWLTCAPVGRWARGSSSPTSSATESRFRSHRARHYERRSRTGAPSGTSRTSGSSSRLYLAPDGHGGWTPLETPGAFVYGTGPSVDPLGLIDAIWAACHESDIPWSQ